MYGLKYTKCPLNKDSILLKSESKKNRDCIYLYERSDEEIAKGNEKYCVGSWIPSVTTGGNKFTDSYAEAIKIYNELYNQWFNLNIQLDLFSKGDYF